MASKPPSQKANGKSNGSTALNAAGKTPRVAVIGAGYWGKNLVRNFHNLGSLAVVCDTRTEALKLVEEKYKVATTKNYDEVLANPAIDAVVIALPAVMHYDSAKRALLAGKDVYVEKPLALHVPEARELVDLAHQHNRILMVGHILEYHPAIIELKRLITSGELGKIQYIYSNRLNLGKLRTEENILWSFAPHDISAILFLLGEMPLELSTHGGSYLNAGIVDTTLTSAVFRSGVRAHIFVSWLHPVKEQKLTIVADKQMAVFDDVEPERKLVLYPHRINWLDRIPVAQKEEAKVVEIARSEPLENECRHFLESIVSRKAPRTDGESALKVLQVLEACEQSLKNHHKLVAVGQEAAPEKPAYYAHPSAIVDQPCQIGEGTKIWHFSHVMANSVMGKSCNLGQNVLISPQVRLGDNVKIQNNVSVYTGVELEDDVFCGPSMVFTNVFNPRSHINRKSEYRKTLIKRGASLGANCTIVCGTTIGQYAFIGAGAVVTKDVPDYALMMGVPARQTGWMCYCGERLPKGNSPTCEVCGRQYSIDKNSCREISAPSQHKIPAEAVATKSAAAAAKAAGASAKSSSKESKEKDKDLSPVGSSRSS
jgi:UDP-2-acetamido-3-amino-2,3-dideoxy-glucuronate N-acetyltransferase